MQTTGFDELKKHLEELEENVKKLGEKQSVSFNELFPPSFMAKSTNSSSIEELLQKGNFDIKTQEDFEKIPDYEMDSFIKIHTRFSAWSDMLTQAFEEWSVRQMGL